MVNSKKIQAITQGSQIIDQIFWEILILLKNNSNLTEARLVHFIKRRAKELGAQGQAFPPIVAFGRNSSEVHHFAAKSQTKISSNNFLMFDFGVKVKGFCSDFTRTVFLGQPRKFHEDLYNLVLTAQKSGIRKVQIGVQGDEVDYSVRHVINSAGLGQYYIHSTGHGVTEKIHDLPNFKTNSGDVIKKGDIVTVEPGVYFKGKFGIRIEDMVLVGKRSKVLSQVPTDFQSMIIKI